MAAVPPPPISGGTLLLLSGPQAIAADPDRDMVHIVSLSPFAVSQDVALQPGDEPGRAAEDGEGRVHVALRGGGALVTIDPSSGAIVYRRAVCPAPRGVAWDSTTDLVHVACATGELVSLPASGGAATRTVVLDRDLRDVIVQGGQITVSRFRSAELLRLAADGSISQRILLPDDPSGATPQVAWRAIPSGTSIYVVHQRHSTQSVNPNVTGGYGGAGASIVDSVVTRIDADGSASTSASIPGFLPMVLPVDVDISPDGLLSIAAPGNAFVPGLGVVGSFQTSNQLPSFVPSNLVSGQAIAVAFVDSRQLLVQTREPAALWSVQFDVSGSPSTSTRLDLSTVSRQDTGFDVFHTQAGVAIACASCHPEGGDDGHVWQLDGNLRRTASLRGTIAGTAPYHWTGDEPEFGALAADVYTQRMAGAALDSGQAGALQTWVEAIPAPPAPTWVNPVAAALGQALFERADVGCASCHSGAKFTNNATLDVGTGQPFQVPPLVGVGWRAPFLHNGCAPALADRFGACSTPQHGTISQLSPSDVTDLTAYLDSL
jgi:hypothetical protein